MEYKPKLTKPYSIGSYNKVNDTEQWIRITEDCPNNCSYCFEPREVKIHPIPEIVRNKVKIMDMNLLSKKQALDIIQELGTKKVNGKVVYYELICGIDYRFTTQEIADALKQDDDLIDTYLATAYKVYKKGLNYFQPEEATRFTMMYLRNSYKIQDIDKD
jgi:hypothetical protein